MSLAKLLGLGDDGASDERETATSDAPRRSGPADSDDSPRREATRAVMAAVKSGSEDDLEDALDAFFDLRR